MILREHGYLLLIIMSAVFFAVAFLKKNRIVGYRTPRTINDQSAWKIANVTFGICTAGFGLCVSMRGLQYLCLRAVRVGKKKLKTEWFL
jgi:uncharacterized membrane protein